MVEDDPLVDDPYDWNGSAFCILLDQSDLILLTNIHCLGMLDLLEEADELFDKTFQIAEYSLIVEFPSGEEREVDQFYACYPYDIAVLTIDSQGLREGIDYLIVPLIEEDAIPLLGDRVAAVGSPYGLTGSVTVGVISAYRNMVWGLDGVSSVPCIQTDAAINGGNSGGPLLAETERGYFFIGVNTWSWRNDEHPAQDINFAIDFSLILDDLDVDCPILDADKYGICDALKIFFGANAEAVD
ncbi:MAG TPA: trypsin-like peptidase domain-containing protein [Bacteroidales bacterium]|nr:trypsin-like peptidase domain-containing protein [Candidatus Fermentibacter daniensis]HPO40936.1 trypsin-like peptidase domain-containing protein [Bacteroidales bacterium]